MFKKILVANRGEIACPDPSHGLQAGHRHRRRLFRCRSPGAPYADFGRGRPYRTGAGAEAYLVIEKLIAAAQASGSGDPSRLRLSRERGGFRRSRHQGGTDLHRPAGRVDSPWAPRALPGTDDQRQCADRSRLSRFRSADAKFITRAAAEIGYPVLIKAAMGGGNRACGASTIRRIWS